jgi:broad specificity phosphatase PhoE
MWQDPIVQETRELREQYAAQFNHDPDAIFEDILKRQNQTTRKVISLSARKPAPTLKVNEIN